MSYFTHKNQMAFFVIMNVLKMFWKKIQKLNMQK